MAGKRHHFIPQFLQRGFASHVVPHVNKADDFYAWLFRKGTTGFNTNIKNVALEGQFYNHEGDTSVDDTITDAEGPLATFVAELRNAANGTRVNPQQAAALITHVSMRTRHIRQSMKTAGGELIGRVLSGLSDPEVLERKFVDHVRSDPAFMMDTIKQQLLEVVVRMGVPEDMRARAVDSLLPAALERLTKADLQSTLRTVAMVIETAATNLQGDSKKLEASAKEGHLRVLRRSLTPSKRLEVLSNLTYRVQKFLDADIILGDSGAVYAVGSAREAVAFLDAFAPLRAVVLPLDPATCLVGCSIDAHEVFATSNSVRRHVAECAFECFLADAPSESNQILAESIGINAHLLSDDETDAVIRELGLGGAKSTF